MIEPKTVEERDQLIKDLQEMTFGQKWSEGGAIDGYYVDDNSEIVSVSRPDIHFVRNNSFKNIFKTKAQAESSLAYTQLTQLMAEVNGDWVADWLGEDNSSDNYKYTIYSYRDVLEIYTYSWTSQPIAFKTAKIRDQFFIDHQELLKTYFQIAR